MARTPPSARWATYEGWDWGGMKERLEKFMSSINKQAIVKHANRLLSRSMSISDAFSAGQYWCCFELTAEDGALLIARVRLPPHPDTIQAAGEAYTMECEAATMRFVSDSNLRLPSPKLFAFEDRASAWASQVGAPYMLIEGLYGNTLQDVEFDICNLPAHTLEKIITQWTAIQAELATISFPQIGSICENSKLGGPVLGRLSWADADGLSPGGPFNSAKDYHVAIGEAKLRRARELSKDGDSDTSTLRQLGPFVFLDIVRNSSLFDDMHCQGPFSFNHMDLGTQNLLVDEEFNIIAVIDWEFAQSAPIDTNYFPMPFPLKIVGDSDVTILADPNHLAYENVSKQAATRDLYLRKLEEAETTLAAQGKPLPHSIAAALKRKASKLLYVMEKFSEWEGLEEELIFKMIKLSYELEGYDTRQYFNRMLDDMNASILTSHRSKY